MQMYMKYNIIQEHLDCGDAKQSVHPTETPQRSVDVMNSRLLARLRVPPGLFLH